MKERPILFSGPMVRAILEGRKTQTRRIVKPQPIWIADPGVPFKTADANPKGIINCPYGKKGDRLWVRETFGNHCYDDENSNATYFMYRADYPDGAKGYWHEPEQINWCDFPRWRPSIHMPREAARIILEIDEIRVERVQDITLGDIAAEGNPNLPKEKEEWIGNLPELQKEFNWFIDLWNKINSKRGYGWDQNPWVWVVKFHVLEVENNG